MNPSRVIGFLLLTSLVLITVVLGLVADAAEHGVKKLKKKLS